MLRFAEEIILLMLQDNGRFASVPSWSRDRALAGAVLMDLALEGRIDTDPQNLVLIDDTPVGDSLLDDTLADIAAADQHDARYWVEHTAKKGERLNDEALKRLIDAGILELQEERRLGMFRTKRYPLLDGSAEREVKLRIMEVLFSDKIPGPRDIVIIGLANACGIFRELLPRRELQKASDRIEQVRKLDLIGQATTDTIRDMETWMAASRIEGRMF